MTENNTTFSQYPKVRQPLPDQYRRIYEKEYLANREGKHIANRAALFLERWMHRVVGASGLQGQKSILELGPGTLNHLDWETPWEVYDVVEPEAFFLEKNSRRDRINTIYSSLDELPMEMIYEKILSIAVLEHMTHLPAEIARSALHLSQNGGFFIAGVPSEGGFLWRAAYTLGTGLAFKLRTGLNHELLMRYEHVNSVDEIEYCIRYFYSDVTCSRYPLHLKHASLYTVFRATSPDLDRCREYLHRIATPL